MGGVGGCRASHEQPAGGRVSDLAPIPPVCGKRMSETLATGKVPDILKPFALDRFTRFHQVGEKGAASVGH